MASPFRINFNIEDYKDILPQPPTDYNEILNADKDIEDQFWTKIPFPLIITTEYIFQEAKRIKQGVWILIKGELLWIPGNYYFFLQYWNAAGRPPQFRLKRLKAVYRKIRVRNNPKLIGTFVMKNRKDGETLFSVCDGIWEVLIEEQKHGAIAMQSKTRDTVIGSCWKSLVSGWNGMPMFFKNHFFSDFTSGSNISEQLKFQRSANPNDPNDMGKNVNIVYGPCVYNAFDAYADIIRLILDEVAKWVECSFYDSYINYKKIIMPGSERRGLFDVISSPADTNGKHNDEAEMLWNLSDGKKLNPETDSTHSRLLACYSNPLDGIEGKYDKYGDCDPQDIYEHIMRERKSTPKDKLMGEIRGYPLPILNTEEPNPEELFGATDTNSIWINKKGITDRRVIILEKKAALVEYGIWEWPNNVPDSGEPVWRAADTMQFNDDTARFCISHRPENNIDLRDLKTPPHPSLIQSVIGTDPFNLRYSAKNQVTGSQGAGICWKFRDFIMNDNLQFPTSTYFARPWHQSIYHEDMILWCLATRSMIHYENKNTELEKYFEDRGYLAWMLVDENARVIETPDGQKVKRGAAADGRGANDFMNNGISFINGVTNRPLTLEDKYLLEYFNHEEVLEDALAFNKVNTQKSHFTMAWIQALIGRNKILFKKIRKKDTKNNMMLQYLLET